MQRKIFSYNHLKRINKNNPVMGLDNLAPKDNGIELDNSTELVDGRELLIRRKADRIKSRTTRKYHRESKRKNAALVKSKGKAVGVSGHKSSLDGFSKKSSLPPHHKELFNEAGRFANNVHEYIDKDGVVRRLSKKGRGKLKEVLIVLLSACDYVSNQIGVPKHKYFDTISHDAFMLRHAKRFGYAISSSSWYRYIAILKAMNIFRGESIWSFNNTSENKNTRSEPSYKWFSKDFLTKIGAYKDHIKVSVNLAYSKAKKNGLSFIWKVKNAAMYKENTTASFDFSSPPI